MTDVHENISPLIAAYALGAVPDDEVPAIRAHVLSCEECFAEAESYAASLSLLAEVVEPVPLSKGFEESVLGQIRSQSPARSRREVVRNPGRWLVGAVATAFVLVLGLAVFSAVRAIDLQQRYRTAVAALVDDPDALQLRGAGGAEAAIASTGRGSVLVAVDLGDAPEDRDYQLWLMRDGKPVPAETFDAGGGVVIVESTQQLDDFDGAAVTVEPEGGSEQPTTDPVLSS